MNRCSNRNRSVSEVVIGIDHGYGNIKTANTCFRAGVTAYEKEPYFIIGSLQTMCGGDEALADLAKRLIFSKQEALCS